MLPITFTVEKNELGGYSAIAQGHNIFTAADTLEELKAHLLEAVNLYFEAQGIVVRPEEIQQIFV